MSFETVIMRFVDGVYWASLNSAELGYIDGRGVTEAMAMTALKANIRAAARAHTEQKYCRFNERYPNWKKASA